MCNFCCQANSQILGYYYTIQVDIGILLANSYLTMIVAKIREEYISMDGEASRLVPRPSLFPGVHQVSF